MTSSQYIVVICLFRACCSMDGFSNPCDSSLVYGVHSYSL